MGISVKDLEFVVLDADYDLSSFECSNAELKDFLTQDALSNQVARLSVTRLAFYKGRPVGYFTLVTDVIKKSELDTADGEQDFRYTTYPAFKIARFATHREFERQGVGRAMLLKIFCHLDPAVKTHRLQDNHRRCKAGGCRVLQEILFP